MKSVYLLVGPKGSGKTFIGSLMQQEFGIYFLRVEGIAMRIRRNRSVDDSSYVSEVFREIELEVRDLLVRHDRLVFESTGVSEPFERMLQRLQQDHRVVTIGIEADDETCLRRVHSRDRSSHVDVSDDEIRMINSKVRDRGMWTDATIMNQEAGADDIRGAIALLLGDER